MILELLKKCEKTAIILPEHTCCKYAKALKKKDKMSKVFVGKEDYSEISWMFSFDGQTPPFIFKRIMGIGE